MLIIDKTKFGLIEKNLYMDIVRQIIR